MRTSAISLLAMATSVSAHARLWSVWVNGEDQGAGKGNYYREPPSNSPVKDIKSSDIACNVNGGTAMSKFVSMAAGDKLTFEWYHDNRADDIIAASHKGPIITYIAPYTADAADGAIWSKIGEDGYDGSKWAVDKLISNGGKNDVTVPSSLAKGKYLIRQEIIGLHEADAEYSSNQARGAQFYPACIQVEVTKGGSATPDQNFDLSNGYSFSDPGIHFNLYGSFSSYTIPGPAIWSGGSSGGGNNNGGGDATTPIATPTATQQPIGTPTATNGAAQPTSPPPAQTNSPSCNGKRSSKKSKRKNKKQAKRQAHIRGGPRPEF